MDVEFSLIERIARRVRTRADVVCGIGDDAALLAVPAGQQLVVTMDTLVAGVHFPHDTAAADIGWKSLAVNLSDLAAMAATPAWCTLALTLPDNNSVWLEAFLDGFFELADQHGIALVGGDTTRGPLSITVTAHGWVDTGQALRRSGARAGDSIWVTGTLGDAAGALKRLLHLPSGEGWGEGAVSATLRQRLDRPTPRIAAALSLRGLAHAMIDLSDGLLADLGHVLTASQALAGPLSAQIELAALPTSDELASAFVDDQRWLLQVASGDDYELCFTAAPAQDDAIAAALAEQGVRGTRIGTIVSGTSDIVVRAANGQPWHAPQRGFDHFSGAN